MEINLAEVAAQAIAFCILLGILRWKAWGPIQTSLRLRREKIQSDFDKIEVAKKELESLKVEYQTHIQKIEDEARVKIVAAIEEGQKIAKEMQDKARLESQKSFEKAAENLTLEVAKARAALRKDIADLAIHTSERVLNEKMSGDKAQQTKILEIIDELEKAL